MHAPLVMDVLPSEEEKQTVDRLAQVFEQTDDTVTVEVRNMQSGESITVPKAVFDSIKTIVDIIHSGKAVHLVPLGMKLSTQSAAEFLGVSRPFLRKLMDSGEIEYEMVGTHHRIEFETLAKYQQRRKDERKAALKALRDQADRLDLDY